MRIFSFNFWFFLLPLWCFLIFILWFIPWVFLLYSGLLIYFPYKDDGVTRYLRITGSITSIFSTSWTPKRDIPNSCKAALVASEDARFYQHNGVDFESLKKILNENKKSLKTKRGGSTITQQLVKNAFLSRNRSYVRKTREVIGALLLDAVMSKENQIEWYLNIVEFGPNTYGLEEASRRYFKVDSKKLSPSQCVALIAILPSPKKWNQSLEKKRLTQFFIQRYKKIYFNILEMQIASRKEKQLIQNMDFGFVPRSQITQQVPKPEIIIEPKEIQGDASNESIDDQDNNDDINNE
ncbi:MAG: transglycosylase domain-containing protein [Silvanigrellaceae bacterium]|nr:transglycosylase domain-containing protein [Silvanigrellaceae bacterium]